MVTDLAAAPLAWIGLVLATPVLAQEHQVIMRRLRQPVAARAVQSLVRWPHSMRADPLGCAQTRRICGGEPLR
jgi:hypothetical protein